MMMRSHSETHPHRNYAFHRWIYLPLSLLLLTGCSLEASLSSMGAADLVQTDKPQNYSPDFIAGEVVTTGNGTILKGTFGEISEKRKLTNGITIEGSFY